MLAIGVGAWLVISVDDSESADGPVRPAGDVMTVGLASAAPAQSVEPETKLFATNAAAADINGLKISSQSWRRGGLGAKALVTFTPRNDNPYAVKDVAIACAFSRQDGSHLTDRTRVIPGDVRKKSRKTFAAVPVGFVNVNANKAKCALVAANKDEGR